MSKPSPTTKLSIASGSECQPNRQRMTLYVPLSRRKVAEASLAMGKAQLLAGGWTTRHVAGGWIDPQGNAITEPVDEHEFLVPHDKAPAVHSYLRTVAQDLLDAGEQAVLLVIDGPVSTYLYTLKG